MKFSSSLLENAVNEFAKLPGVGKKTALRFVLHLLKQDEIQSIQLSDTIKKLRSEIQFCSKCFNISDHDLCKVCSSPARKKEQVCVVESIRDVMAIEATEQYNGTYHVLGGVISPLDGIVPDMLQIQSLIERVKIDEVEELIMALSPTIEGDTTTYFIAKKLNDSPIKITTLSRGVAFGGELEYTDELTLARSFMSRLPLENVVSTHS